MKKTLIIKAPAVVFALALACAVTSNVYAQESSDSSRTNQNGPRPNMEVRDNIKAEVVQIRTIRRDEQAFATATRAEIKDIRSNIRATTSTSTKMDLKAEIEMRKEDLAARRASSSAAIKETAIERVNNALKLATSHLNQEIQRLTDIKAKIDTRLDKFDQNGGNTSVARADLALAVTSINTAQADVTAVGAVTITTDLKASAEAIRTAVKTAQESINAAQKALSKVVSDMRGLEAETQTATTTSSTENQ